jgi:hypothetical protein
MLLFLDSFQCQGPGVHPQFPQSPGACPRILCIMETGGVGSEILLACLAWASRSTWSPGHAQPGLGQLQLLN